MPFILPIPFIPPASNYMDSTVWIVRDFLYPNTVCDSALVSGVENITDEISVSVFPNPAEDVMNIYSHYDNDLTAEIFSVEGKLMAKKFIVAKSFNRANKKLSAELC